MRASNATPWHEYRWPILQALVEMGGRATTFKVLERIRQTMNFRAVDLEHMPHRKGERENRWRPRYEAYARFARYHMVGAGLLKSNSLHGVWAISPKGRSWLRRERRGKGTAPKGSPRRTVTVRTILPKSLVRRARVAAETSGHTLSELVASALERRLRGIG